MTQDSQYPFSEAEEVEISIDAEKKALRVRSVARLKTADELQNEDIIGTRRRRK